MTTKILETGYTPRDLQVEMHMNRKRFNVLVLHRRAGKTVFFVNDKIDLALRNQRLNPQYFYIAPYFGQVKRIAWEYVKYYTRNIPGVSYNEAELRCVIPRMDKGDKITIYLLGADNPAAIRGVYADGVTLDEYAEMDPALFSQIIRPAVSDRKGWITFGGTPKGMNHFYDILEMAKRNDADEWYYKIAKASETGIIDGSELAAARSAMTEEEYAQEFECSFSAALIGSYYGKEMDNAEKNDRITKVPYDPSLLVSTSWDLGIDDSTAIWFFQQCGREIRCIDYLEDAGQPLGFYAEALKKKEYKYDEHFFPHDVAARDLSSGRSREETLRSLGVTPIRVIPRQKIEDRINATRMIIPQVWFDAVKCERGIRALKNYQRKWDSSLKIFLSSPLHDWSSHASDSFGCFALGMRDQVKKDSMKKLPRQADSEYDVLG